LLLRQSRKAAQKVAMGERPFLPALDTGLFGLQDLRQRSVPVVAPLTAPVGNKPVVENRVDPTAQIPIGSALVPARERPFETVLNEIVGALSITAQ
jgi:hypothetical protein